MNGALRQYIELYDIDRELINSGSAGALNTLRAEARQAIATQRLPRKGDEGYEKTSIDEMFAPDYGINLARVEIPFRLVGSFRCSVPDVSSLTAFVSGDTFVPSRSLQANLPDGVKFMSLAQAAEVYPEIVGRYYGTVAPLSSPGVSFNSLLAQDGVFIHIPRNVRLSRSLQIVNMLNTEMPQLAIRRLLVVAEENSAVDILLCDHTSGPQSGEGAVTQVTEIIALPGASVRLCEIEETSENVRRYNQLYCRQMEGSSVEITTSTLLNGTTRNEFNLYIDEPHCTTGLYGMAIGSERQHIDNFTNIVHGAPRCTSNQLFRYVLDRQSTGAFEGGIEVTPEAPFTAAYQNNNNILASDEARMYTKPQLLIYNDDVKCSHGATTGQLDQQALFYMQTRGIPMAEARTMLMQAFMSDVVNTVGPETLRTRLRHLVEQRFAGNLGSCTRCSARPEEA